MYTLQNIIGKPNFYSLQYIWNFLSIGIAIYGLFVIYLPNLIPNALSMVYRYGKTAGPFVKKQSLLTDIFTLPKRWFQHFYIIACVFHTFLLWTLYQVYFKKLNSPAAFFSILTNLSENIEGKNGKVLPEDVIIAVFLMILQVYRRFIECHFVSVYSDAKMSLLHYSFGMFFYIGVGLSIILEAPGFSNSASMVKFTGAWLTPCHVLGAVLFLYGWYIELESHLILADIRKSKEGKIMKNQYSIPEGGMFDMISCPHYFGEITMYFAICFVFNWNNYTWNTAFVTVLVNQIMAALMSHEWYKKTFKNYPSKRKALIPFVL